MAHWHDFNPWADSVIYLPSLEELSACLDPNDPDRQINRWHREHGSKLDAYILPSPSGDHSCGIRYGAEGSEYYSPFINPHIAELLISKYGPGKH
jgi:hypothetical protein